VKLEWSSLAIADREQIFEYIETDNPIAAIEIDARIEQQAERLLDFPRSGRVGRVKGTREFVVVGTAFVAAYRISGDTIRILRVLHGAQPWPKQLPGD